MLDLVHVQKVYNPGLITEVCLFEDFNLSSGKHYDFSFVVIADHDIPGMTVKPQKLGDDETYFSADRYDVKANVPTAITLPDNAGFDGALRISLDFGGTPAGTKVHLYGNDATDATGVQVMDIAYQTVTINNLLNFVLGFLWQTLLKQFARSLT